MKISIKVLNNPNLGEIQYEVDSKDTIQQIKLRLSDQLNIPINQQKLVFKGKSLHDGSLGEYQIIDGSKIHLMTQVQPTIKPVNSAFVNELYLLAAKWIPNPNERDSFVTAFQKVNQSNPRLA